MEGVVLPRNSHDEFFSNRPWAAVSLFWGHVLANGAIDLPWLIGDEEYGFCRISELAAVAEESGEFGSADVKYSKRRTFCLRVGYRGEAYHGYQQQPLGILTVEQDLKLCLSPLYDGGTIAAGRTDKDVSALSQVVCFSTFSEITSEQILDAFRSSEPCREQRLAVFECHRVPRRMHPIFCALWRRYTYLMPLNVPHDIDAQFVHAALQPLVGVTLHYRAYAYGEIPVNEDGSPDDLCIIYRASAVVVNLDAAGEASPALCITLVGNRFLRRQVRNMVATVCREAALPESERDVNRLVAIANEGRRLLAAFPVPGVGLALTGVGYDAKSLDFRSKVPIQRQAPLKAATRATPSVRLARKERRSRNAAEHQEAAAEHREDT